MPRYSPDGKKIAFLSVPGQNGEVCVIDSDGSNFQQLTNTPGKRRDSSYPAWSPNGKKIAFASDRDGFREFKIYVMNVDGSNAQRLTRPKEGRGDAHPAWSPDGERIAFHSNRDGSSKELDWNEFEIYVMDVDGSNLRRITTNSYFDAQPDW